MRSACHSQVVAPRSFGAHAVGMRIIIVAVAVAAIGCVDQDLSTVEQNTELSWYGWQSKTVANGHTTFVGPYIDNATDGLRYGIAVSYPAISGFTKWC